MNVIARWARSYRRRSLGARLAAAFVLGAVAGIAVGPPVVAVRPLGDLFIRLLQLLVIPIVVSTVVAGIAGVSPATLSRLGARTVLWYLLTALAATGVGVAVAVMLRPGDGMRLPTGAQATAPDASSWGNLVAGLVPDSLVVAVAPGQLLPTILVSMLFALGLAPLRRAGNGLAVVTHRFFEAAARASYTALRWVMEYAPVGTFALVAVTFAERDAGIAAHFATAVAAVYLSQAVVCVGCAVLLAVFSIDPLRFARAVNAALVTAFVTGSSAATLPVELEVADRRLRIERSVFAFTLPLGVSIHKLGTAAHLGVVSMFAAFVGGTELSLARQALITLFAFLAAVGTPPISGGALLMLGFVFTQAGLPMEVIGVIAGIPFLGKFNTPINSFGRFMVTAVVARAPRLPRGTNQRSK